MSPFISICIPAYKRTEFLQRLFDSIMIQDFRDFEIIVTDDSPSNEVEDLCTAYRDKFLLHYYRNRQQLGTPENWNESIRKAKGQWVKIMHDDDWFADKTSLGKFAAAAREQTARFIFSGYTNVFIETGKEEICIMSALDKQLLAKSPVNLLKKNFIGHPSTTLISNDLSNWYDSHFKWVVDIEFYIRRLQQQEYYYLPEPLVNLGMSSEQVTATAFRNPQVEIPENIAFLKKLSPAALKKLFAYDYYWRFIRNLSLVNKNEAQKYYTGEVPLLLQRMITQQRVIPAKLMHIGVISKVTMLLTYGWNRLTGRMK